MMPVQHKPTGHDLIEQARAAGISAPACSPCPFCGEVEVKPIRATPGSPAWSVCCSMCNAVGPFDADRAEAVRLWNQRTDKEVGP